MLPQDETISQEKFKTGRNGSICRSFRCLYNIYRIRRLSGEWKYHVQEEIFAKAEEMYLPAFCWVNRPPGQEAGEWVREKALAWIPLVSYAEDHVSRNSSIEDEETLARILEAQANDENAVDENGKLIGEPDESETKQQAETVSGVDTSIEKLRISNTCWVIFIQWTVPP